MKRILIILVIYLLVVIAALKCAAQPIAQLGAGYSPRFGGTVTTYINAGWAFTDYDNFGPIAFATAGYEGKAGASVGAAVGHRWLNMSAYVGWAYFHQTQSKELLYSKNNYPIAGIMWHLSDMANADLRYMGNGVGIGLVLGW